MGVLERIGPIFILLAAFVIGGVLLSQQGGINLFHHHKISLSNGAYTVECTGYVSKTCRVSMSNEVVEINKYAELISFLYQAKPHDKIYIYLAGNGGFVDSAIALYTAIKKSPAKTYTVVTGDVYSAHADLSLAGNSGIIIKSPYFIMMFHRSSIYSIENVERYCEQQAGNKTDRRQPLVDKCIAYTYAYLGQDEDFIRGEVGKVLTTGDIERMLNGDDVILTGREVQYRLDGKTETNTEPKVKDKKDNKGTDEDHIYWESN